MTQTTQTNPLAILSLVFGILAWTVFPCIGAVVAVVCGHLARSEVRRALPDQRIEGDGLAVTGLVLGYAQLVLCGLILLFILAAVCLPLGIALFNH